MRWIAPGSFFSPTRERRGWLKYSDDPRLRLEALNQALDRSEDNGLIQEQWLAFTALEHGGSDIQRRLAHQLMQNGRYRFALTALPTLQADENNTALLLRNSFQIGWWQLFDQTLDVLDDSPQKYLWRAFKQMHQGQYRHAKELLALSGEAGTPWLDHWEEGEQIYHRLSDSDPGIRAAAIADWQTWCEHHPGPKKWQEDAELICKCAGAATLHSTVRDLRMQYYRIDRRHPGAIRVHGPLRIKIEARPVHRIADGPPLQEWLTIRSGPFEQHIPIVDNVASRFLKIESPHSLHAGQLVECELELPAGFHQLEISTSTAPILFRVLSHRPEIPLPRSTAHWRKYIERGDRWRFRQAGTTVYALHQWT